MNLPVRIALRYLFFERRINFISIITACSLLGIAVGVAALICVTSIFNGFGDLLRSMLIGFDPHIRVTVGADSAVAARTLSAALALPDVQAAAIIRQGKVVVVNGSTMQVFMMNAAPTSDIAKISGVANAVVFGRFALDAPPETGGVPRVVLGFGVADKLRVIPGDSLRLFSPADIESAATLGTPPLGMMVRVAGIFQSNAREYDNFYLFASDITGAKLLRSAASAVDIRLTSLDNVDAAATQLRSTLGAKATIETWYDLHRDLYGVMQFERLAVFIVVSIVVCIAAFTILASLAMTVVQKRRDIGILRAMGASAGMMRTVFVAEGAIIGVISIVGGCTVGLGLCFGQMHFGWLALDRSRYIVSAIPVAIHWPDVAAVCALTLVLTLAATIYPAKRAAAQRISEAIREE